MRHIVSILTLAGVAVLACAGTVPAQAAPEPSREEATPDRATGRYIVVLEDDVSDTTQAVGDIARRNDLRPKSVYRNALKGFAATIPNGQLAKVRADERVEYVEPDQVVTATAQTLPWGIDRIDADTSSTRAGDGAGAISNANAYVIDSGIDRTHPDLDVVGHVNFHGGENSDCSGHGTHVAGTVAAKDNTSDVVGAAPGTSLTGVKVLGCDNSGLASNVIQGIDWVTANAKKPAVATVSLAGNASQALDDAVKRSADSGILYAVAAGNDGTDACTKSPARAGAGTNNGVVTVAATDRYEGETSWSNYGPCVDVWAPGAGILSTRMGGGTATKSGTSMAAPHVGGAGALYLSTNAGSDAATVEGRLKADSVATGAKSKDGVAIKRLYAGRY